MPPDGGGCKCGAVGRLQCAFRAQAGNSPLQGQNKPPAKRVVLTFYSPTTLSSSLAEGRFESIVKRYEWELAEWKQQVEGKPAEEKKPPKRSYRDRDER